MNLSNKPKTIPDQDKSILKSSSCNRAQYLYWKKTYGVVRVNVMNTGILRGHWRTNFWVAHLDHDDYWEADHLLNINNTIVDFPS